MLYRTAWRFANRIHRFLGMALIPGLYKEPHSKNDDSSPVTLVKPLVVGHQNSNIFEECPRTPTSGPVRRSKLARGSFTFSFIRRSHQPNDDLQLPERASTSK